MSLLAAGCGARWSGSQKASVEARYRAGSGGAASSTRSTAAGGASATTVPGATGGAGGSAGGSTAGGTAGGGGTESSGAGGVTASGPKPCAAASDAPGISNDTITIGNISTLTGPVPGLGASAVGAVRAYIAYRNANGGVCGRQIVMKTADDGADNGQFRALVSDMAPSILGLVGTNAAGDAGGADVVESLHLPVVATAFNDAFQNASPVFDMNPSPADPHGMTPKYKYLYDQGVRKASIITLAAAPAVAQLDLQQGLMEAAGIQIVNRQLLPLSTLSFDSAARAVANSGADYLFFLSAAAQDASMAQSMKDTGYQGLKYSEYLTAYGSNFIDLAGAAAEGATSWSRTLPNEEPNSNPEQATYLQWFAQTAPDLFADGFAADAWASAKGFFDALEQLSGPISRDSLIAQLKTFTTFDAGGLEGAINLGGKVSNGCFIAMKVVGGVWKRETPSQGFLC